MSWRWTPFAVPPCCRCSHRPPPMSSYACWRPLALALPDKNYQALSHQEVDLLLLFCILLSPDEFVGKLIFPDNGTLCDGASNNEFYEISAARTHVAVTETVTIGGRETAVRKIMAFKRSWLTTNYIEPIATFGSRLQQLATGLEQGGSSGTSRRTAYRHVPRRNPRSCRLCWAATLALLALALPLWIVSASSGSYSAIGAFSSDMLRVHQSQAHFICASLWHHAVAFQGSSTPLLAAARL